MLKLFELMKMFFEFFEAWDNLSSDDMVKYKGWGNSSPKALSSY